MRFASALRSRFVPSVWLGMALWASPIPAQAAPVAAIEYTAPTQLGVNFGSDSAVGWAFDLNSPVRLVSLGAVLDDFNPGHPTPGSAEVGLWDAGGALLASTTVFNTDPLSGHFRYRDITPLDLPAGNGYTVAGLYPEDTWFASIVTDQATPPEVSYVEARFLPTPTLARPTAPEPFFGATTGEFGGTFRFEAVVPEPGTLALLGLGGLTLLRRRRGR